MNVNKISVYNNFDIEYSQGRGLNGCGLPFAEGLKLKYKDDNTKPMTLYIF